MDRVRERAAASCGMSHPSLLAAFGVSCALTVGVPGCRARVTVCRSATLLVRPGELVVVAGPRGAGRTTLLQCLAGMRPPCAGHLRWRDPPPLRVWRGGDIGGRRDVGRARPVRALAEPDPWRMPDGALLLVDDDVVPADRVAALAARTRDGDAVVWAVRAASTAAARDIAGPDATLFWLADGWLRSR